MTENSANPTVGGDQIDTQNVRLGNSVVASEMGDRSHSMNRCDFTEVPAHEIDWMAQAQVSPMRVFEGPRALVVIPVHPVHIVSVVAFDDSKVSCLESASLLEERLVESRRLADLQAFAILVGSRKNLLGPTRVIDERLGADYVLAGSKGGDDLIRVKVIRRIDCDDIDVWIREKVFEILR